MSYIKVDINNHRSTKRKRNNKIILAYIFIGILYNEIFLYLFFFLEYLHLFRVITIAEKTILFYYYYRFIQC